VQINSTVSKKTAEDMPKMAALLSKYPNVVMWSVFFLVPTGRAKNADMIEPEEVETLFGLLHDISKTVHFDVRTTEAMHYRRFVLQRIMAAQGKSTDEMIDPKTGLIDASTIFMSSHAHGHPGQLGGSTARPLDRSLKMPLGVQMQSGAITRAPKGVNEAKGFVFISHIGDVFPSGFLPLKAGNVKQESLVDIYRHSDLFKKLRDVGNLKGKCAVCEFRELCGGSRSRAWAALGDPFASDPTCTYVPKNFIPSEARDLVREQV
jgi:AdoMet-dependent heme synthase